MLKPIVIAGAGIVAGAGFVLLAQGLWTETARASSGDGERATQGERVASRAKQRQHPRPEPEAHLQPALPGASQPKGSPPSKPEPDSDGREPEGDDRTVGGLDGFREAESSFFSESREGGWASKTESLIVTIAQRFPASRATEVECRSKLCRVALNSPSIDEYNLVFRGMAEDRTLAQKGMVAERQGNDATIYIRSVE